MSTDTKNKTNGYDRDAAVKEQVEYYRFIDEAKQIYREETAAPDDGEATTWEPIDLGPWLDGTHVVPNPTVGISRTDGLKLIYPGCEHVVFGETEAGKSWLALECAAVEIRMGHDVVYIHFEEGNPRSTVERLLLLGVTPAQILKHLRFAAPGRPVRGEWLEPLLNPPPALAILDGVNEAMSLQGDEINDTGGAATFRRNIIKPFLAVGAASLSADHVVKNGGDSRGRYQIGSVHKLNALDGAAILMENMTPFGRGLRGTSSVYVTKDRPGQLRANGKPTKGPGKTFMGVLAVDATGNSPDFLTFFMPKDAEDSDTGDAREPDVELAGEVRTIIAAQPDGTVTSRRKLLALLRAAGRQIRDEKLRDILDDLLLANRLTEIPGRGGSKGYKAVLSASRSAEPVSLPASASRTASPLEGDAVGRSGELVRPDASDAVGRTGTQSGGDLCGLCGQELLAPKSLAAGVCEKCHLDAQRLPAETKEVIA